jgi:hypothetical protein
MKKVSCNYTHTTMSLVAVDASVAGLAAKAAFDHRKVAFDIVKNNMRYQQQQDAIDALWETGQTDAALNAQIVLDDAFHALVLNLPEHLAFVAAMTEYRRAVAANPGTIWPDIC